LIHHKLIFEVKMRSYEEYQAILTLWEKGYNKSYISRRLDIPRGTVSDAINRYKDLDGLNANINARLSTPDYLFDNFNENSDARQQYAYLLGLYLGDGCINMAKNGRSYFLRIALDKKYPVIIERCEQAMGTVFFNNSINRVDTPGCYQTSDVK